MKTLFGQDQGTAIENGDRPSIEAEQRSMYERAAAEFSPALARLAAAYEANPSRREDLLQDIHFKLWRSFEKFNGACSLRTWIYRVAHNTAATHVLREQKYRIHKLHCLEDLEAMPSGVDDERNADGQRVMDRLSDLLRKLKPLDRQIVMLYLEGLTAADIAVVTGVSAGNVATKLHRLKGHLKSELNVESSHD